MIIYLKNRSVLPFAGKYMTTRLIDIDSCSNDWTENRENLIVTYLYNISADFLDLKSNIQIVRFNAYFFVT